MEKRIYSKTIYVFIVGFIFFSLVAILSKDISYIGGWFVGYIGSLLSFTLITKVTDAILTLQSHSRVLMTWLYMLKMVVYISGFLLAGFFPEVVHFISVFIGYFIVKGTIYWNSWRNKGGDIIE